MPNIRSVVILLDYLQDMDDDESSETDHKDKRPASAASQKSNPDQQGKAVAIYHPNNAYFLCHNLYSRFYIIMHVHVCA